MRVAELIERLYAMPPEAEAVTGGESYWFASITEVELVAATEEVLEACKIDADSRPLTNFVCIG